MVEKRAERPDEAGEPAKMARFAVSWGSSKMQRPRAFLGENRRQVCVTQSSGTGNWVWARPKQKAAIHSLRSAAPCTSTTFATRHLVVRRKKEGPDRVRSGGKTDSGGALGAARGRCAYEQNGHLSLVVSLSSSFGQADEGS